MRVWRLLASAATGCLVLVVAHAARSQCLPVQQHADAVVKISGWGRMQAENATYWTGSGWFQRSARELVTNWHVASDLDLDRITWKPLTFSQERSDGTEFSTNIEARLMSHHHTIDIAVVELREPYTKAELLDIDTSWLVRGSRLTVRSYGGERLRFGSASVYAKKSDIMDYMQDGYGYIPVDVKTESDQYAFMGGGSGSPALNCKGKVVGMFTKVELGSTLKLPNGSSYVRAPLNRSPNAYLAKIEYLEELYQEIDKMR